MNREPSDARRVSKYGRYIGRNRFRLGTRPVALTAKRRQLLATQANDQAHKRLRMLSQGLLKQFETHEANLKEASRKRQQAVTLRSVVEDIDGMATESALQSGDTPLGAPSPTDRFAGDTAMRTMHRLLEMVDERGFERSAHQLRFHSSMIRCVARVIYRTDWGSHRPLIMAKNGWKTCPSEVMVSTPRRFGKTFS